MEDVLINTIEGRMPDVLVIGAMKCGTSSLHDYLAMHPDIFMSYPKEIHFHIDRYYKPDKINEYKNHFKTIKKIAGTSPQSYTKCHNKRLYQNVPSRIKKHNPNVKMIYIVRDPIERYASHILESYFRKPRNGNLPQDEINMNYIKTGMYYMQLSEFLKHFKKEQIHVLSLEDLIENKLQEMNKIFRFLGVSEMSDESVFDFVTNDESSKDFDFPYVIRMNFFFRLGNKISKKITHSIARWVRDKFYSHLMKKPKLSEEEVDFIKDKVKEDVNKLREFTGNSFPNWSV